MSNFIDELNESVIFIIRQQNKGKYTVYDCLQKRNSNVFLPIVDISNRFHSKALVSVVFGNSATGHWTQTFVVILEVLRDTDYEYNQFFDSSYRFRDLFGDRQTEQIYCALFSIKAKNLNKQQETLYRFGRSVHRGWSGIPSI